MAVEAMCVSTPKKKEDSKRNMACACVWGGERGLREGASIIPFAFPESGIS